MFWRRYDTSCSGFDTLLNWIDFERNHFALGFSSLEVLGKARGGIQKTPKKKKETC